MECHDDKSLLVGSTKDVCSAHNNVNAVKHAFEESILFDTVFDELWVAMVQLAGEGFASPRLVRKQTLRSNPNVATSKEYYKFAYFQHICVSSCGGFE